MKRIIAGIAGAVAAAVLVLAPGAGAATVDSAVSCTQIPDHHAFECAYPHVAGHGTIYVTDNLENNWIYLNPAGSGGLMQVQETYAKNSAPGVTTGNRRVIGFASGAVVADSAWLAHPSETSPPKLCAEPYEDGRVIDCTPGMQAAAVNFWYTAEHSGIGHSY